MCRFHERCGRFVVILWVYRMVAGDGADCFFDGFKPGPRLNFMGKLLMPSEDHPGASPVAVTHISSFYVRAGKGRTSPITLQNVESHRTWNSRYLVNA
jgi:hypothetical protein